MSEPTHARQAQRSAALELLRRVGPAAERKALAAEERSAIVRFIVIAFNIVTYWLWLEPNGMGVPWLAGVVTVVALGYGVYDLLFQPYLRFPIMATSAWTAVTDGVLITLWIRATGDFASPYYVLWYLSLVAVAFRFSWRAPLVASVLYSASYVTLLAFTGPIADQAIDVTIRTAYVLLCGGLGSLLAHESMRVIQHDVAQGEQVRHLQRWGSPREQKARLGAQEAIARLVAVVDSSIDGILTKDLDGRITSWNGACQTMFGYTEEEMMGKPITLLYPKGKEAEEERILERIRAGKPVRIREAERVRKDGTTIWVSVSASPLRDAEGTVVGAAAIKRDITDVRAAEKERLEAKAQVQEFTRLKEVNRFKTEFINTAAHELRTPLLPLRMQLDLMMTDEANPPAPAQRESMEVMQRNLERLSGLVEDLLTVARSQAGRIQLAFAPFDLGVLVREAQQTFRTMSANRAITLTVTGPASLPLVGDAKRINQVLGNLLSNAIKFTPDGGKIKVTLESDRGGALVAVRDTGRGIAPANLDRLFQPFVQVHDTAQVSHPGSGLGLYICRQLVELHGGTVGCESPGPGQGATFWFTLPSIPFRPTEDVTEWNPTP